MADFFVSGGDWRGSELQSHVCHANTETAGDQQDEEQGSNWSGPGKELRHERANDQKVSHGCIETANEDLVSDPGIHGISLEQIGCYWLR